MSLSSSIEFESSSSYYQRSRRVMTAGENSDRRNEPRIVRYPESSRDRERDDQSHVSAVVQSYHPTVVVVNVADSETSEPEHVENHGAMSNYEEFDPAPMPSSPIPSESRKSASSGATETTQSTVPFSMLTSSSAGEKHVISVSGDDRDGKTSRNVQDSNIINGALSGPEGEDEGVDEDDEKGDVFPSFKPTENYTDTREPDRFGFLGGSGKPTIIPVEVFRRRESKWLEMLGDWQTCMTKRFDKVRSRCRKGIPSSLRPRAWKYLCGAQFFMTSAKTRSIFETLDKHPGDSHWNSEIVKDLNRQFPNHELFSQATPYGKFGQEDLFRVLKAWTLLHPEEGYCQAQAPIAAALLMHMPAHEAFYCFAQICQKYLPGYFSPGLEAVQLDGDILFGLLKKHSYPSYKHLKKQNIDPVLYMVEWFMCIFCRTLPWPCVLRVLDMFFCEGVKVLFKVGVFLFKYGLNSRDQLKACPSMYETIERLRHLPIENLDEEYFVQKVVELNITDEDLERVHYKQVKARNKKQKQQRNHITI